MNEISKALNQMIAQGELSLVPFNNQGLSFNPWIYGAILAYVDEKRGRLRLYANVCPLEDYMRQDQVLLLDLLGAMGPAADYPEIRLGLDQNQAFLWLSQS